MSLNSLELLFFSDFRLHGVDDNPFEILDLDHLLDVAIIIILFLNFIFHVKW